ncbi:hypothetical protein [Polynucleobacter necessarius]|uniref:hypothetical protein n=1 Tax=Polynucleobacter necessarius TaxID=576610 RepID=UPI0018D517A1|nr:hypothetical protein [Polynucleobacter necessarius]
MPDGPIVIHYEKNHYPLLSAYMPFWMAESINRLIFILLPFFAITYPVLLALPSYRIKRMQNKINRLYVTLKLYEEEWLLDFHPELRDDYLKKLDLLKYQALRIKVPKSLSNEYYALRTSIDYVRNCLN